MAPGPRRCGAETSGGGTGCLPPRARPFWAVLRFLKFAFKKRNRHGERRGEDKNLQVHVQLLGSSRGRRWPGTGRGYPPGRSEPRCQRDCLAVSPLSPRSDADRSPACFSAQQRLRARPRGRRGDSARAAPRCPPTRAHNETGAGDHQAASSHCIHHRHRHRPILQALMKPN